jgi:Chalcone isomerase-like
VTESPKMKTLAAALAALLVIPPLTPSFVREPRSGAAFAAKLGNMSLLGVGLRTKSFLRLKVYAIGLYVADSALSGPLRAHRDQPGSAAFYRDLIAGDFEKQIVLKPLRDLSAEQIQDAFRQHLPSVDPKRVDQFVAYFPGAKTGQECTLRWAPGGVLETNVAGLAKPPIADRAFSQAVFAIWLGDKPVEDLIRRRLVSRAPELLAHP